ncbi:MAG: hypothetical protein BGO16_07070 [Nitrobacter sp. 62-23]|nr:MAG: hypothetical protein BGO16_07070 [Nitrobacter sp. 62-23]
MPLCFSLVVNDEIADNAIKESARVFDLPILRTRDPQTRFLNHILRKRRVAELAASKQPQLEIMAFDQLTNWMNNGFGHCITPLRYAKARLVLIVAVVRLL